MEFKKKQLEAHEAIMAYIRAKKVEENINNSDMNIRAIVQVAENYIAFYIVNKKDYNKAMIDGINEVTNKSLIRALDFEILDDYYEHDINIFHKSLSIINKVWLRSIEF